jgi:hypothetical protein
MRGFSCHSIVTQHPRSPSGCGINALTASWFGVDREGDCARMINFRINDYVVTTREYPYHHVFGHIPKGTQFTVAKYKVADETSDGEFVMVLKDRRVGWLEARFLKIV